MGQGYSGGTTLVDMSLVGLFQGKESSNRIKISPLVQDLLNFGILGSLPLWRVGGWGYGVVGGCPTHVHMHSHACTHMHMHTYTHIYTLSMIISIANGPWVGVSLQIINLQTELNYHD